MNRIIYLILLTVYSSGAFAQSGKPNETTTSRPFVLGTIEAIASKILGEKRILNIYLPEGYKPGDSSRYPVIYLLDGSADEDFIHIVGLVQFYSFDWIRQVPRSIVVGIATVDRRRDFTFPTTVAADKKRYPSSGHADEFIDFIEKELQPFIAAKYKTSSSRTIIGQSLGGLLATEILLKRPAVFDKYIIVSPSLWWDNGSLLEQDIAPLKASGQGIEIYIGVGKEGLTPTDIPRVMEVDANVLADKVRAAGNKTVQVYFDYLPEENHATILHQAVSNAFKKLYPVGTAH